MWVRSVSAQLGVLEFNLTAPIGGPQRAEGAPQIPAAPVQLTASEVFLGILQKLAPHGALDDPRFL